MRMGVPFKVKHMVAVAYGMEGNGLNKFSLEREKTGGSSTDKFSSNMF